jgi:hypothetical protein
MISSYYNNPYELSQLDKHRSKWSDAEKKKKNNKKSSTSSKTVRHNQKSNTYVSPLKVNPLMISMSGYILLGKNKGKKLSKLSIDELLWYKENLKLSYNELAELEAEVSRREKK